MSEQVPIMLRDRRGRKLIAVPPGQWFALRGELMRLREQVRQLGAELAELRATGAVAPATQSPRQ